MTDLVVREERALTPAQQPRLTVTVKEPTV